VIPIWRTLIHLLGKFRAKYEAAMKPIGSRLGKSGLRPNTITTLSLLVSILAGGAYLFKSPILGALGLVAAGFIDMLDGAVARATGTSSKFGAVYDHVLDRYAEFAVLLGIGLGGFVDWPWIVFALFGMVMASYTRAKAESVGGLSSCTVGIAERQEKIILLLIGSVLQPYLSVALTVCAIAVGLLSHVTVVQRLHYTLKQTRGSNVAL
jgi:phosphatidylglycerophosphate synthase